MYPPQGIPQSFSPSNGAIPPRPGSIPGQPGALPPRPGFGAPPPGAYPPGAHNSSDPNAVSASLDDLISEVTKEAAPEKKSKKDKNMKLIFFDDNISPEEKMALLPRFAEFMRT